MDGPILGIWGLAGVATPGVGAPGTSDGAGTVGVPPADPIGRPPNPFSKYAPLVLILVGGVIVVSVILGRLKAAKLPKPPSLEERLAALGAEKRAQAGGPGAGRGMGPSLGATPRAGGPAVARGGADALATRSAEAAGQGVVDVPLRLVNGSDPASVLDAVAQDAEELAERLAIAMDARAARLEGLIREADLKIRRLEELRRAGGVEGAEAGGRGTGAGRGFEAGSGRPSLVDQGHGPARAVPSEGTRAGGVSLEGDADPIQRQVFALADQGVPALEIARRVNQPTGQVELMLALRAR